MFFFKNSHFRQSTIIVFALKVLLLHDDRIILIERFKSLKSNNTIV